MSLLYYSTLAQTNDLKKNLNFQSLHSTRLLRKQFLKIKNDENLIK
jgi:hypothetical protein